MQKDTYADLEEVLVEYIQELGRLPKDSKEAGIIAERVDKMFKSLLEADKVRNKEVFDEVAQELEKEKQSLSKEKVIMDLVKIFGPVLLSIIAYAILQKRLLKFEENGRLCTSAAREFHMPKFWR